MGVLATEVFPRKNIHLLTNSKVSVIRETTCTSLELLRNRSTQHSHRSRRVSANVCAPWSGRIRQGARISERYEALARFDWKRWIMTNVFLLGEVEGCNVHA